MAPFLFVSYSGAFGGAERVLLDCAEAVPGSHSLACPEGVLAQRARARGLTVFTIRHRPPRLRGSARDRLLSAPRLVAHALEVRALARDLNPDAIVAWGMRSAIAFLAWPDDGRPVAFAHNDILPRGGVAALVRAVAARAAVVIVPSRAVALDLDPASTLTDRVHVVAPGVDLERFRRAHSPAQPPEALVVGALVAWKLPELALEACAVARLTVPDLHLRFVGAPLLSDDPTLDRLRERATRPDLNGVVEFAGEHEQIEIDLAGAACLLHCAPREPFGLVVAEALAAGCPVVVPDTGGPAEIVDSDCALLYAPGDPRAAGRALAELVGDPELAQRKGDAGRRRASRHLDRTRSAAQFAAVLTPLTPAAGPAADGAGERLALVTVSRNSEHDLRRLLESARRHLPAAQVIVVDNASSDRSVEVALSNPRVTTVELDQNVGFGRASNRGIEAATAPVVVLLNPDVELLDDSLLGLTSEALRSDRPERLLAPLVLSPDGSRQDTVHPLPASAPDLARAVISPAFAGPTLAPWKSARARRVGWAVGCALAARTETLRRLGPFDESIFLYGEDLELSLRAAQQGVETWFWPDARVLHHRAHSSNREFGGEPFELVARARHDVVRRRLGVGRARLDDVSQAVTFASRVVVKRALRRPAARERRQLEAVLRQRER